MSQPIGPGDWVECVRAPNAAITGFRVGGLYVVAELSPTVQGIALAGMPRPYQVRGMSGDYWQLSAFRPVYRPKSQLIETLKQSAPVVREVETA